MNVPTTKKRFLPVLLVLLSLTSSCRKEGPGQDVAPEGGLWAEVLDVAGSTETWTWDGSYRSSPSPTALPAPGYFGYFPLKGPQRNLPPLEMLLLGKQVSLGKKAVVPIGVLRFRERESSMERGIIVAVPAQVSEKTVRALTFLQFMIEYDALKRSIEIWAQHAPGFSTREILRWEDEVAAKKLISQGF